MTTITTTDGTQIYYKDWGTGQPVVFSHGWPLNSDSWEAQMMFLASNGYRCIAHDRRGHGRSGHGRCDAVSVADQRAVALTAVGVTRLGSALLDGVWPGPGGDDRPS